MDRLVASVFVCISFLFGMLLGDSPEGRAINLRWKLKAPLRFFTFHVVCRVKGHILQGPPDNFKCVRCLRTSN